MANYVDSNKEAAVARFVGGGFTAGMERMPFIEFLKVLLKNTDYLMPDAESLRQSSKRSVKAKIMKTVIGTATESRSCVLSGTFGDAVNTTLNWQTAALTGKVSLKQSQDNEFAFQEQIAKRLADLRKSCLKQMEVDAKAWFAANQTTVNDGISYGSFDVGTNVWEVDPTDADNPGFLNIVAQMMAENRYRDDLYEAVVNGYTMPQLRFQANQGQANAENKRFQFDDFLITNGLGFSDANYPNWFGYFFQQRTVGSLLWLPEDYRNPTPGQSVASNVGVKQVIPDPEIPGLNWALKSIQACEDTTSSNGGDDDEVLKLQLSADYSFNYAPTEDGSTPIFAVGSEEAPA